VTTADDDPAGTVGVVGAGATGIALAALVGGIARVVLVCRDPARAALLRRRGARVTGALRGRSHPEIVPATADLAAAGPLRAVFVATKTTAIPAVAADLRAAWPRPADRPMIVSFQNGIDPGREMIRLLGSDRVLRMVLNFAVSLREPGGEAEARLVHPLSYIGCLNPGHRPECEGLAALLTAAGLQTRFDPALEARVWAKAVVNASMNPVAALVNATVGEVLDSPSRLLVGRLLRETIATARAMGLDLGPDPEAAAWAALEHARPHTPSMVEDIRAGRESEVGQLNRQIAEHARTLGVPVPTHEAVDALIETFDWKLYARRGAHGPPGLRPAAAAR
jgi:2-dehydropantoate 2-reductase